MEALRLTSVGIQADIGGVIHDSVSEHILSFKGLAACSI